MNSMEEQYGIDANFISEVADYLKCGVSFSDETTSADNDMWTSFLQTD